MPLEHVAHQLLYLDTHNLTPFIDELVYIRITKASLLIAAKIAYRGNLQSLKNPINIS